VKFGALRGGGIFDSKGFLASIISEIQIKKRSFNYSTWFQFSPLFFLPILFASMENHPMVNRFGIGNFSLKVLSRGNDGKISI